MLSGSWRRTTVADGGTSFAHSVLSEAPRPDRGFGRGFCFGLILAGSLYMLTLVIAAWLT